MERVKNRIDEVIASIKKSNKPDHWKNNKECIAKLSIINCRDCEKKDNGKPCGCCITVTRALKLLDKIEREARPDEGLKEGSL